MVGGEVWLGRARGDWRGCEEGRVIGREELGVVAGGGLFRWEGDVMRWNHLLCKEEICDERAFEHRSERCLMVQMKVNCPYKK